MPSTVQYRYLHKGENEWLSEPHPNDTQEDQEAWNEEWVEIRKEHGDIKVEFTEDMYTTSEFSDLPEYLSVTIQDEMLLQFKMARGVIKAIEGAAHITFHTGIDCFTDDEWGNIGTERIAISPTGAWATITPKHGNEEVEVDITEQFNQAIGESV